MKRFRNIPYVVGQNPLQENPGTLDKLTNLARLNDARIKVMAGGESQAFDDLALTFGAQFKGINDEISSQQRADLSAFLKQERWQNLEVAAHTTAERGFIPIIKKVLQDKHDLVIKEATVEEGIDQLSMRLVRKCPCPVWIIKKKTVDFKRILGAVDIGSDSQEAAGLNKKIIELSHSLAQREQGEAFYFHSWRLHHEAMLRGPRFNVAPEEIITMKRTIYDERLTQLQQLLNKHDISALEDHVLVREGRNKELLNKLTQELSIDVVVMGSVGRSGIPGLLIGNEAEKILSTINCTVLTVKPDGFISPVTL